MRISNNKLTGQKQNGVTVTVEIPQSIVDELQTLLETVSTPEELLQSIALENATEEQALTLKDFYPWWSPDIDYKTGDRVRHPSGDGVKLYEVLQDHTSTELQPQEVNYWYVDIAHRIATDEDGNPTDEYPDWVQPTGYENVYKKGDIVKHNGKVWILDADTSAHEPGTTHSGWIEYID